ncbi:MAG: twin-arginine translocase TatA/TatE family subunit [Anaerolineaceae bacterium]|jgi:Sec-independent protein translocase protein TatA
MSYLGAPELILILIILLFLFGVGQIGKIRGEFGKGFKLFCHRRKDSEPEEKLAHEAEKSEGNGKSGDNIPPSA